MGRLMLISFLSIFLLGGYSNSFSDDHYEVYELLRSGDILPLEKILDIIREQVQGQLLEVELEHDDEQLIYELEVLDKQGVVWEIEIDATTGTILKNEQD